jgi:formyl-CoA transferase
VLRDPQALENGFVSKVTVDQDMSYMVGVSPAQFDEKTIGELHRSPTYGQHTDEILREVGLSDAEIAALRSKGAIS